MDKLKVVKIESESIVFDNGAVLSSNHDSDCCEEHYLKFDDLTEADFEGLEFDLTGDDFFRRIEGYGIALIPVNSFPVKVPGYASNNGYYSSDLELVLIDIKGELIRKYDITECQQYT